MTLTSVTIPCQSTDLAGFERLLCYWSEPRLFPLDQPQTKGSPKIVLLVVLDQGDANTVAAFQSAFGRARALHNVFARCQVRCYNKPTPDMPKVYTPQPLRSSVFFYALQQAAQYGGFTFVNHLDCFPMRRGWLNALRALAVSQRSAWQIGTYCHPIPSASDEDVLQINANALYQVGDADFGAFVETVWQPRLFEWLSISHDLTYESWWAHEHMRANSTITNTSWKLITKYKTFFCNTPLVSGPRQENLCTAQQVVATIQSDSRPKQPVQFVQGAGIAPMIEDFLLEEDQEFDLYLQRLENPSSDEDNVRSPVESHPEIHSKPVAALPAYFQARNLEPMYLSGNWHLDGKNPNWIQAGHDLANIHFALTHPIKDLVVVLRGTLLLKHTLKGLRFSASGAPRIQIAVAPNAAHVRLCLSARAPFSQFRIQIRQEGAQIPGYALTAIELLPVDPATGPTL